MKASSTTRGEDRAVGERLEAPFESEVDARREQGDADEQDRHLKSEGLFDAQDFADAGGDHRRSQSERGAGAADQRQG